MGPLPEAAHRCPSCHVEVRPGMIHCRECGSALTVVATQEPAPVTVLAATAGAAVDKCVLCGAELRRGMLGCRDCGHRVGEPLNSDIHLASKGDARLFGELMSHVKLEVVAPRTAVTPVPSPRAELRPAPAAAVTKPCRGCGKVVESEWHCCPWCKTVLKAAPCKGCGKVMQPEWHCCPWCQTSLVPAKAAVPATAAAQTPAPAPATTVAATFATTAKPAPASRPVVVATAVTPAAPAVSAAAQVSPPTATQPAPARPVAPPAERRSQDVATQFESDRPPDPDSSRSTLGGSRPESTGGGSGFQGDSYNSGFYGNGAYPRPTTAPPRRPTPAPNRSRSSDGMFALPRGAIIGIVAAAVLVTGVGLKNTIFRKVHRTVLKSGTVASATSPTEVPRH